MAKRVIELKLDAEEERALAKLVYKAAKSSSLVREFDLSEIHAIGRINASLNSDR